MKLIKRGNKLLFQNNSGKPTETLDLSVNIINFQNNKILFSGTDLEINFSIFESVEDGNGTIKLKADFANFAELEKYLQENIFYSSTGGGGGGGGGGEVISINSVDLGVKSDASATSDSGTFSLISLFKRSLAKLTSIATNTSIPTVDRSAAGNISADSESVSVNTQGSNTVAVGVTGTWAGSLQFQGELSDGIFAPIEASVLDVLNFNNQTVTSISSNGNYTISCGGFLSVRIIAITLTSGDATITLNSSVGSQKVVADLNTVCTKIAGQAGQTAVVSNILNTTSGAAATNLSGFKSASVQVVSTGTGGTFIFEGSNDGVNFQPIPVFNSSLTTSTPIVAAITATATNITYYFPVITTFIRLRIVTAITGGSIRSFSNFSQVAFAPAVYSVAQSVAASLNTTATISGTLTTQTLIPTIVADVASAALTTTTTTSAITPTLGVSYAVNIPVTVVTGTNPALDVVVQESADSGTNWYDVYHFSRITAVGSYNSPNLILRGNRLRYVQTVTGTTPSFTRAINRLQSHFQAPPIVQIYDRTFGTGINTINSKSAVLNNFNCSNFEMVISLGAGGTAPTIQLQCSFDGLNWVNVGAVLQGIVGETDSLSVRNTPYPFVRGNVTIAGSSSVLNYFFIRAF